MQILPKLDSRDAPDGYVPLLERSVSSAQPFADVMNRLIKAAREHKIEKQSESSSERQAAASGNNTQTLGEVSSYKEKSKTSKKEPDLIVDRKAMAEIAAKLKEYGMSDDDIADIKDELNSDGEIAWQHLQKTISNRLDLSDEAFDPELTEQEQAQLLSFFQKINFTVEQANRLIDAFSDSDSAKQAWSLVKEHLNAVSDESLANVTGPEVSAVAKALGVPEGNATQLAKALMAQVASGEFDESKVKDAVNLLLNEAEKGNTYLSEKAVALEDILESGLHAAAKQNENSTLADNRDSKDIAIAKVRMEDEAEKKYGTKKTSIGDAGAQGTDSDSATSTIASKTESSAPVTRNEAFESEKETRQAAKTGKGKSAGLQNQTAEKNLENTEPDKTGAPAQGSALFAAKTNDSDKSSFAAPEKDSREQGGKKAGAEDNDSGAGRLSQDADDDLVIKSAFGQSEDAETQEDGDQTEGKLHKAWEELLSKLEVKDSSSTSTSGVLHAHASQQGNTAVNNVVDAKQEISAARVMKTVENGMLTNMGQGRSQLTIRLDPPSLGQLTVSLQVKNDEVQAIIKTDNEEVGKMLTSHLNLLRHSLEQQGLKVEKLDVQTQMQGGMDNRNWQSAEQHNQAQQQTTQDQWRSSLRALQHLSMQGESLGEALENEPGRTAQSGLHLIA